jgi:DNA (cytosine-5)-methyltransferase 1
MTIGALFAGIGGLELGLERAGLGPVSRHVEIDPTARAVLARHWPEARAFSDVRTVRPEDLGAVDLICGGFPCQDLSSANVRGRRGLNGAKSGLWREFLRIVGGLRPGAVVVENVESAWRDWVPVVRGDLYACGYSSVPLSLSPASIGAKHDRRRVFVVAYPHGEGERLRAVHAEVARLCEDPGRGRPGRLAAIAAALSRDDGLSPGLARLPGNAVDVGVSEALGRAIVASLTRS